MRTTRLRHAAIASLVWACFSGQPRAASADAAGAPVPLAAHHATYKLSLLKSNGANAPAAAAGVIDYDFSGSSCDGYATKFRQITEVQPAEGDAKVNDMQSTTFEDGGAGQFTFKTQTTTDGETVTDLDGRAQKGDGKTAVALRRPAAEVALGPDVLFPTEHLRKVIATAMAGGRTLTASVYDGSDTGRKLFRTLSIIGPPVAAPATDAAANDPTLKTMRRWPVAISYFEGDAADRPDYVLSFDLYENGVSSALRLDYGEFVLAGALTDLRLSGADGCAKP